jgi:hypothetical protein
MSRSRVVRRSLGRQILRLHGSVTWRRESEKGIALDDTEHFVARCPVEHLTIAPPGPEKQGMIGSDRMFMRDEEKRRAV